MPRFRHWLTAVPLAVYGCAGPFPQSFFYASTKTYDLTHTCNTWTAAALRVAGLPVSEAGIVFAGQVLDQVRPLAEAMPQHVQGGR